MATCEPKNLNFSYELKSPQEDILTSNQQTLLLQQQESQFQRDLGYSENYSSRDISLLPKKLQGKENKKQDKNFFKKIQYEAELQQKGYDLINNPPKLKRAIQTGLLYDFLNYCRFKYIASPQLHRHLFLYENCHKWHTTKKGKRISGHYFSYVCPGCKILDYKRLPCGSVACPICSKHLRNRRFHKILPLLADNKHAYFMIRLPEKLKNLPKFNYKNSRNLTELYSLIEKSLKEYALLQIKENNHKELNLGFYVGLHTYSTSTLKWDLHFNILLSLLTFNLKSYIPFIKSVGEKITLKDIKKYLLEKYRNSKEYKFDFERARKEVYSDTMINVTKKTKTRIEVEHLKFNLPQFFSKFEIKYFDYNKLRDIINKNIEKDYGQEFTDKNLYIRDAYSKDKFSGEIIRKSPEHTAGLLSSYLNNIPVYDKNILKITKDKITIKLKDTLKSNQKGKTVYKQFTLPHLNFFNRYQQHLLYVNYASPEATNKQRISTFRNLRGYGLYSNNSLLSLAYKKVEKEPEQLTCKKCDTEISHKDIGLVVFNGIIIYSSKSILHIGLRLFLQNGVISEAELEFLLIRMSKPPPFLIPTTQPQFPGERKEKIQDFPSCKSEIKLIVIPKTKKQKQFEKDFSKKMQAAITDISKKYKISTEKMCEIMVGKGSVADIKRQALEQEIPVNKKFLLEWEKI